MRMTAACTAVALVLTTVLASEVRVQKPRQEFEPIPPVASQTVNPADPEAQRQLMISWAQTMESTLGLEPRASRAFQQMSGPVLEAWYGLIEDPARFSALLSSDIQSTLRGVQAPEAAALAGTLFPPDYPPGTGAYRTSVLDETAGLASDPAERCDTPGWANKYQVWVTLHATFQGAEVACIVGGCDPTGIACAIICGVVEGARLAEKVARLPIDACEVHGASVDAAEIEASYENTLVIASDIENARSQILTNDNANRNAIVSNDNINRDAIISNDNANREITIGLFDDVLRRDIMSDLGLGRCEHWMYTPMYADEAQTIPLGGHLETAVELIQTVIDQGALLGADPLRLAAAQERLDSVLPLAMQRPLDAEEICLRLESVYKKARMLPLEGDDGD